MKTEIFRESEIDEKLDAAIKKTLVTCFPRDRQVYAKTRAWHGSTPAFTVIIRTEKAVIAHLGVVDRTIKVKDQPLRVAGVQNVCVLPQYRGKQLSRLILTAAMSRAAKDRFDCGLLFTRQAIKKVYARTGWQDLGDVTVVRIDTGRETTRRRNSITMFYPINRAQFPKGPIHLQGNDW